MLIGVIVTFFLVITMCIAVNTMLNFYSTDVETTMAAEKHVLEMDKEYGPRYFSLYFNIDGEYKIYEIDNG